MLTGRYLRVRAGATDRVARRAKNICSTSAPASWFLLLPRSRWTFPSDMAGLISFGHAAFIGLGAYAVGILSAARHHRCAGGSAGRAIAVSVLFAWLTGIVCLRTKGAYFIMITLAFGQMVYFIASSLAPYGGDDGLTIAERNTIAGLPLLKSDPRFLLLHPRLPGGDLFAVPQTGGHRVSAACYAAPKRTQPARRRSASTFGESS